MTTPTLYEQVMGTRYASLAPPLQRFHRMVGHHELHGWVTTQAPASPLARMLAKLLGTPTQAVTGPIRFELKAHTEHEVWTRHFPMRTMTSTLTRDRQHVMEHLGAARLRFALHETEGQLTMRLQKLHFLGLPCPSWLMPTVIAQENGTGNALHFTVTASVPLIGRVADYRGHLDIPMEPVA